MSRVWDELIPSLLVLAGEDLLLLQGIEPMNFRAPVDTERMFQTIVGHITRCIVFFFNVRISDVKIRPA